MLDTHAVARSLTDAEFTPAQADAITNVVRLAAEHGDQVTSDQFKAGLDEVRTEIAEVRTEIAALDTRLSTQIANLDTRLSTQIAGVRTEVANLETRLIRWMVGTVLATGGLTFGILRFLLHARRRGKPGRHPDKALSPAFVRSAPPGRHCGAGQELYPFVQPSGTRSWIQRLAGRGRRCELGRGSIPLVSLAEAREKAVANRKVTREGGNSLADKRRLRAMPTFAEAAARVLEQKRPGWRSPKHGQAVVVDRDALRLPPPRQAARGRRDERRRAPDVCSASGTPSRTRRGGCANASARCSHRPVRILSIGVVRASDNSCNNATGLD